VHASNTVGSIPAPLDATHVRLSTNSGFTVLFHFLSYYTDCMRVGPLHGENKNKASHGSDRFHTIFSLVNNFTACSMF
jgi:hypothetical protein